MIDVKGKSLVEYVELVQLSSFHYVLLTMCSLVYALTGRDTMLIAALQPPITEEWALEPLTQGLLASIGYVGMFVGAIGCGFLADLVGRKRALLITTITFSALTGLCASAWDALSMGVLRFVAGIGLGGALPQPGVYISEYVPAKYRGRFLGVTESAWVYGALLAMLFGRLLVPIGWRVAFSRLSSPSPSSR